MNSKLIILRGNSGCGKSTVAKRLRELSDERIVLVEQDYFRRVILEEFGKTPKLHNAEFIFQTVTFALDRNLHVILEGILTFSSYENILTKLYEMNKETYVYYFDVSLEETIRRHQTKPNKHEFGEDKLREWYTDNDVTGFPNEKILPETYSLEDIVNQIKIDTGL